MGRLSPLGNPRIGIIQFPGSNCDADCFDAFSRLFDISLIPVWHQTTHLPALDGLIFPGGFSYGDYLRGGALASHSMIMPAIKSFIARGGAAIGICNGFQVLTEAKLLPGILLRNEGQKFLCHYVNLHVASGSSIYHSNLAGKVYKLPIAHGEGRYYVPDSDLNRLKDNGQILFQYASVDGAVSEQSNPNGAVANIAGITSENGRVLGMMPHPERASHELFGSNDGLEILKAFVLSAL